MEVVLFILTILVAIPVVIFTLEVLLAIIPQRVVTIPCSDNQPTITVLVPAHNESGTIENTLVNINEQLTGNDRVLVVADNCSDDTASIAKIHDAEVIERTDLERRGKGYALDYGVRHLEKAPPDIVIIIDADCQVEKGALAVLANNAIAKNRPIQALYLMSYTNPTIKQRIAEFAWLVKNYVRPRGLYNIGMPCQLMGTGMAFPWNIIAKTSLATGNIVEDVKMGLDMAASGYAPLFCPDARVSSIFPEAITAEDSQRKRWEHGHLSTIFSEVPKGIIRSVRRVDVMLLVLVLDLAVPPLALLTMALLGIFISSLVYVAYDGLLLFAYINLILLCLFFTATLVSWYVWGRKIVSLSDLLRIPFYVAKKIPLYISFLIKKEKSWVKTGRKRE